MAPSADRPTHKYLILSVATGPDSHCIAITWSSETLGSCRSCSLPIFEARSSLRRPDIDLGQLELCVLDLPPRLQIAVLRCSFVWLHSPYLCTVQYTSIAVPNTVLHHHRTRSAAVCHESIEFRDPSLTRQITDHSIVVLGHIYR